MTKGVITRKIKVNNYSYDLEIYPNLDGHKEIAWEIFPRTHKAALYAFSNKDKLNKIIESKHIYEPKKK
jgi:hypothetical protein